MHEGFTFVCTLLVTYTCTCMNSQVKNLHQPYLVHSIFLNTKLSTIAIRSFWTKAVVKERMCKRIYSTGMYISCTVYNLSGGGGRTGGSELPVSHTLYSRIPPLCSFSGAKYYAILQKLFANYPGSHHLAFWESCFIPSLLPPPPYIQSYIVHVISKFSFNDDQFLSFHNLHAQ